MVGEFFQLQKQPREVKRERRSPKVSREWRCRAQPA